MKNIIISPSILNVKKDNLEDVLNILTKSNIDYVHIDVMDGKFVPNTSYSLDDILHISKSAKQIKDVHIMINDPKKYALDYLNSGADILTFHLEACNDEKEVNEIIDLIHSKGKKAGLSIKPNTPVEKVFTFLQKLDLVLIMSVEPGFGGQKFLDKTLERIHILKEEILKNNLSTLIEVDGGINDVSGRQAVEAGADILVAGTYIFGGNDIQTKIDSLKNI